MKHNVYPVTGMSCAACAARVQKAIAAVPGVKDVSVNYASAKASVACGSECSPEALRRAVQDAGYDLVLGENAAEEAASASEKAYRRLRREAVMAAVLCVPLIVIGMGWMHARWAQWATLVLASAVLFGFGGRFFAGAWRQLRHRSANMDTLVALSTGIAYAFSLFNMFAPAFWTSRGIEPHVYFEAAGVIIAFILFGRTLEARAKRDTSSAISSLMGLQPVTVTQVSPDGSESVIKIEDIRPGMILRAKAGERIATDGVVVDGASFVDESMLSGEPVPVDKAPGSKVYSGTVNGTGSFTYRALVTGADTLLARIIRMVEAAQGSRPPVQNLVDKVAAVFVPVIIAVALAAFAVWVICDPAGGLVRGMLAAVTVLIIACPCALGLATPTALMVGIGRAAENGILIRDADSIETARRVDTVLLDKTGTLTQGHPGVREIVWADGADTPEARAVFAALEKASGHPLGEAVAAHLKDVPPAAITDFNTLPGSGVEGRADGRRYFAGSLKLMHSRAIAVPDKLIEAAHRMERRADTLVMFADDKSVMAIAACADSVRPTSAQAIDEMRRAGLDVWMLTGDNRTAAEAVAREVGIANVCADALPADKALLVERLRREGRVVAMAGDGINDSAALAAADLSIAMGTGSDIAMEVAGMTIVSADLTRIPQALRLSRLTMRTVKQNLFWAFVYNVIGVPVAAGVLYPAFGFLLNPMIAGAAMAFSSVSVVTNSLMLKKRKLTKIKISTPEAMTKTYKVAGMMCGHCRAHVERALNSITGVKAVVTLDPAEAIVEYASGTPLPLDELQAVVSREAGDYTLSAK